MSTLHTAIFSGWGNGTDLTDVEALLDAGEDPNAYNEQGNTPLTTAAMLGAMPERAEAATRLLLSRGADPNRPVNDRVARQPLHIAVTTIANGTVRALLEGGANPNANCAAGATPLYHAIHELKNAWNHGDIANPNGNAATAAAFVTEHIRALSDHGADFTSPDPAGNTALPLACMQKGCPDSVFDALLDAGVSVTTDRITVGEESLDMLAASMVAELSSHVAARFLAAGCRFDIPYTYFGNRPYVEVAPQFVPEIALVLALANPDFRDAMLTAKTHSGFPLMVVAADAGHKELVEFFAQHGQRLDMTNDSGKTILEAVEEQSPEHLPMLRSLL